MSARARHTVFATLLAVGVGVLCTTAVALANQAAPQVQTQAPMPVTTASAVLHGLVDPGGLKTTYWFEIGTTTAYGTSTNPASAGKGDEPVTVNHGIGGLQPATTHLARTTG